MVLLVMPDVLQHLIEVNRTSESMILATRAEAV